MVFLFCFFSLLQSNDLLHNRKGTIISPYAFLFWKVVYFFIIARQKIDKPGGGSRSVWRYILPQYSQVTVSILFGEFEGTGVRPDGVDAHGSPALFVDVVKGDSLAVIEGLLFGCAG